MRFWKGFDGKGSRLVGIVVAAHFSDRRRLASFASLVSSLRAQTHPDWLCKVVHDGPVPPWFPDTPEAAYAASDPRMSIVVAERKGNFGHPHRRPAALAPFGEAKPEWFLFANDDSYYAPPALEWAVAAGVNRDLVLFDMVHSHRKWSPLETKPCRGSVDIGSFLASRRIVEAVPWPDHSFAADGLWVEAMVAKGAKTTKIKATLFMHN